MKNALFLSLTILCFGFSFAQADSKVNAVTGSQHRIEALDLNLQEAGWVKADSVCFSNANYDSTQSRATCEDASETVSLMSNDNIVFQVSCRTQTTESYCIHQNGVILETKALVFRLK